MTFLFDIFHTENDGLVWIESAETQEAATARAQELASHSAGEYIVLNQRTGNKIAIRAGGAAEQRAGDPASDTQGWRTMNNPEFESREWEAPLQEIIFEYDREKLAEKISKIEAQIHERLRQPHNESNGHEHREDLNDALATLRTIKRDRLGITDPE